MKPLGVVYFMRGKNSQLIKIGFSRLLKRRLGRVAKEAGELVELLAFFDGTIADERAEHRRFARYHVRGEWFMPHMELNERIETLGLPDMPDLPPPDEFTRRAREWVMALEELEASRLGIPLLKASPIVAAAIGVAPGTLFNLRGHRITAISAHTYETIRLATIQALKHRKAEIVAEIAETEAADPIGLAMKRRALGLSEEPVTPPPLKGGRK